jgi:hypothetical protein
LRSVLNSNSTSTILLPVCCGNCVNWYVAADEEFEESVKGDAEELFTFEEEFGI